MGLFGYHFDPRLGGKAGLPSTAPPDRFTAARSDPPMLLPVPSQRTILPVPGEAPEEDDRAAATRGLLHRIALGEGTDDASAQRHGFASGYDVPLGYGAYGAPDTPLSGMTIRQVMELQGRILNHPDNRTNSTAVGKYQIARATLRDLMRTSGVRDSEVFDVAMQERLARQLLVRRKLDSYLSGSIGADEFQGELAKEWASIQEPGKAGTRTGQHLGTTSAQIQEAIAALPRR